MAFFFDLEANGVVRQQLEIEEFAASRDGEPVGDIEAIKKRKKSMIEAAMEIWSLDKI